MTSNVHEKNDFKHFPRCFWIVFIAMHLQKNISLFIYLQKKSACINS